MARAGAWIAIIMIVCAFSCAQPPPQTPPLPAFVTVEFRGALIAPTRVNGDPRDGPGPVDNTATTLVANALLNANPYRALLSVFANPTIAALDKPEPYGDVRVTSGGVVIRQVPLETNERDTLTPLWNGETVARIPLSPATRIEVTLIDRDLSQDDAMGTATISYQELVAALRSGVVYHVPLAEQTHNQVLFLDVSVVGVP
jgi:hypothetical protein